MSNILWKQFEIARGWSIEVSKSVSKEIVDVKPKGFNNSIHWQIGHIITSTEYFLFELPSNENNLPASYPALFGSGTKPDDWKGDVPSVGELIIQMEKQLARIKEVSLKLDEKLLEPMHGFETFGDSTGFSVLHEVLHVGKIEEMERIIVNTN